MAHNFNYRHGSTNSISVPVESATVVEVGQIVLLASGYGVPATALADAGTEAQNQEAAHDAFLGIALTGTAAGETENITVATTGVFELPLVAAAAVALGALLGPAGTGAGDAVGVSATSVEGVATANLAIGRCVKAIASGPLKVLVEITGTVTRGGPYAMA